MALSMKDYERRAKFYERRWKEAISDRDFVKAYQAERDYRHNCEQQAQELKAMDPNSREYEQTELAIDKQKTIAWDMYDHQRMLCTNDELQESIRALEAENMSISEKMSRAVQNGDVGEYNYQRKLYDRNIECQQLMVEQLRYSGIDYPDTIIQQKNDELTNDIHMRDKMNEIVAKRTAAGKNVPQDIRQAADQYTKQAKQDEIELVKMQNEREIESMRKRGASGQEIENRQEEHRRSEEWVKRKNS